MQHFKDHVKDKEFYSKSIESHEIIFRRAYYNLIFKCNLM